MHINQTTGLGTDGFIGIGTPTPQSLLHLDGNNSSTGELFRTTSPTDSATYWRMYRGGLEIGKLFNSKKDSLFGIHGEEGIVFHTNGQQEWVKIFKNGRVAINNLPGGIKNPAALLHLGEECPTLGGWRSWMKQGTFTCHQTDHIYLGFKKKGQFGQDGVLCWGDNPTNFQGPDNFRIIYTAFSNYSGVAGSQDGLEVMRFIPNGNVGIGDFWNANDTNPQVKFHVFGNDGFIRSDPLKYYTQVPPPGQPNTHGLVITDSLGTLVDRINFNGSKGLFLNGEGKWGKISAYIASISVAPVNGPTKTVTLTFADGTTLTSNAFNTGTGGGGGEDRDWVTSSPTNLLANVWTGVDDPNFNVATRNVGIGTQTPQAKTHIKQTSASAFQQVMIVETGSGAPSSDEEALTVYNNGNVRVGNGDHLAKLHVNSNDTVSQSAFRVDNVALTNNPLFIVANEGHSRFQSNIRIGGSFTPPTKSIEIDQSGNESEVGIEMLNRANNRMWELTNHGPNDSLRNGFSIRSSNTGPAGQRRYIFAADSNNNVGIRTSRPQCTLDVNGTVCAQGTLLTSDSRYKTNVDTITNPLQLVQQLEGIYYDWDTAAYPAKEFESGRQLGFVAQDVEQVVPEVVRVDQEGYYAMDYARLVPVLVEAIKDQQEQIDALWNVVNGNSMKMNGGGQVTNLTEYQGVTNLTEYQGVSGQVTNLTEYQMNGGNANLQQNIPNPFALQTTIPYSISQKGFVQLNVYNIQGKQVASLVNTMQDAGNYHANWSADSLPQGQYLYELRVDGVQQVKQAILVK